MCRRGENTANRGSVTAVRVRVQNDFRHTRSSPAVDGLLKANGIKGLADGLVAKDLDGGDVIAGRQDGCCFTGGNEMVHGFLSKDTVLGRSILPVASQEPIGPPEVQGCLPKKRSFKITSVAAKVLQRIPKAAAIHANGH